MVMLTKICESRRGTEVFALRNSLLIILSELLLFAPQVRKEGSHISSTKCLQIVEYQVIETIEKLIRHFKPSSVDVTQFVQNLIAVIAKAISLQIKDKAAHKTSSYNIAVSEYLLAT